MRRDAKVDANQAEIVEALRAVGCRVAMTFQLGSGYPDLTVLRGGVVYLLEVKSPGGKLTPAERKFHDEWADADTLHIIRTIPEALAAVGAETV